MISTRFAPTLCVVVGLALVPTVIHDYIGMVIDDGRRPGTIAATLAGYTSSPTSRHPRWGRRLFETDDWFERKYLADGDEVVLTVIRSYDLKRVYHHPELAAAYGTSFVRHEIHRFTQQPSVPVHVLRSDTSANAIALYALHYEDGFVESPMLLQIRAAAELLFSGRRPMTLIFAHDVSAPRDGDVERLRSASLLLAAIKQFAASGSIEPERRAQTN